MTLTQALTVAQLEKCVVTLEHQYSHGVRSWFVIDPYNLNLWPDNRLLTVMDAISDKWRVVPRDEWYPPEETAQPKEGSGNGSR